MNYLSGAVIKELREKKQMTQKQLADIIGVSDKAVSKWETGKGFPDIGIIEELAGSLGVSIAELLTGDLKQNENQAANMKKMHFYLCPVCGNVITAIGQGNYTCCGITLPELESETDDEEHQIHIGSVEDEYLVSMNHEMQKKHYISFIAFVTSDSISLKKLYPEQEVSVRIKKKGHGYIYACCNRHGLFRITV